ncbi:Transmembrane protein 19 [Rhizophlyctis rosea]|uniref:Transmembrane protein 19 n=1 Tax=Rhizophlyctis rosea TaxID=64517 RepID=A0AAD5SM18_9FUNG|nr:Transmembrane protein 19 [Rhizophlyctis rosea]
MHPLLALTACSLLAYHGIRKKSLSKSGSAAAFLVGLITFSHPNNVFAVILIVFYLSSSRLTKYKAQRKQQLEEDFKVGGQRTATQVLSNGLTGTFVAFAHWAVVPPDLEPPLCLGGSTELQKFHTILILAYMGHYACCNGDTWASELGILSTRPPILITTLKEVPRGTNGGVSPFGLAASLLGGLTIGVVAATTLFFTDTHCTTSLVSRSLFLCGAGAALGLTGSLIDSLLGATLQKSVYNTATKQITPDFRNLKPGEKVTDLKHISGIAVLDNHQVNFISSWLTAALAAFVTHRYLS